MKSGNKVPEHDGFLSLVRDGLLMLLLVALAAICTAVPADARAPADAAAPPSLTDAPEGMLFRWVPPFYMTVPAHWKPMVERREGIGFFTGIQPQALDRGTADDVPMVALMVTRQPAPKGGGYKAFLDDIEKEVKSGKVQNFVSKEEETTIGGQPAVFFSFSGEGDVGGSIRKMEGHIILSVEADAEGKHTLVALAGTAASIEKYRDEIKSILASAREAPPPLVPAVAFPYGSTQESFRHIYGPAVAADGVVAVGESLGNGRVRIFSPEGALLSEWGSRGKGEDGTFNYPQFMTFGPDGSLYVIDQGYSVDPNIQRFSRTGEFLGKIRADKKILGDEGIYSPSFLAVTDSGKIVVVGLSEISGGVPRALVFSPEGTLLHHWEPGDIGGLVALPGDRLLGTKPQSGNDRAELFTVLDIKGNILKEWPFFGSDLAATPGDDKIYFRPKFLAADAAGRIYAYDDSEDAIWMYDDGGRFLYAVPARPPLGIVGGMAATPEGDLVFHDRPGSYGPGEPSIHIWKNAFPARPRIPAEVSGESAVREIAKTSVSAEGITPLEAELAALKEALRLREEAGRLEDGGNLAGAAAKYRESLPLHEDPEVERYAGELEERAEIASMIKDLPVPGSIPSKAEPPKVLRSPLYDDAEELERSGRRYEALRKYREGLAADFHDELKEHADALEKSLEDESRKIVEQAVGVQKEGKLEEALDLYRQSLEVYPVERIREYADRLEALIQIRKQGGDARTRAEEIWRQAVEIQKAGRHEEALAKYREGLAIFHNAAVAEHVGKLEEFIRRRK